MSLKTAARKYSDLQAEASLQLSVYSYATSMNGLGDQEDVRLRFDVPTKTTQPELHRYWTNRDRAANLRLFRLASELLRAIQAGGVLSEPGVAGQGLPVQESVLGVELRRAAGGCPRGQSPATVPRRHVRAERKAFARSRRSAIAKAVKILRSGGEYLQAREASGWTALTILGLAVLAAAVVVLATIGRSTLVQTVAILSAVCVLLSAKAALPKILRRLRATQKGRLGERLTAQLVSRLSDDYYLINDIVLGRGNIDHVIVGPCGVLAIETKRVGGDIRCDGDDWTVKGRPVRSYSKQVKAAAMAVKAVIGLLRPELRNEYVEAVVVLTDPHCRVTINRAQVGVVRFSELLPFITALANKRHMNRPLVHSIVAALAGSWATGATAGSSRAT